MSSYISSSNSKNLSSRLEMAGSPPLLFLQVVSIRLGWRSIIIFCSNKELKKGANASCHAFLPHTYPAVKVRFRSPTTIKFSWSKVPLRLGFPKNSSRHKRGHKCSENKTKSLFLGPPTPIILHPWRETYCGKWYMGSTLSPSPRVPMRRPEFPSTNPSGKISEYLWLSPLPSLSPIKLPPLVFLNLDSYRGLII